MNSVLDLPDTPDPRPWLDRARGATAADVARALASPAPGIAEFAALISAAADAFLEPMADLALRRTRSRFGRTISLYAPLYLSNYCSGSCAYCGFAASRKQPRRKMGEEEIVRELHALKRMGLGDVLLLTGERCPQADVPYLRDAVRLATGIMDNVTVESFAMTVDEYRELGEAGCTGMTLYQETYDPVRYAEVHPRGFKADFRFRLEAPARALEAGLRTVGIGALLGLADPLWEALALYRHIEILMKRFWRAGVMLSFPRLCPEKGHFRTDHPVGDRQLARMIFAFRICLPDVPLVLSTRERAAFRDGMAGLGICRMSVASKTTVGGYTEESAGKTGGQFDISDERDVDTFCRALRDKGLFPVFKNWDPVLTG